MLHMAKKKPERGRPSGQRKSVAFQVRLPRPLAEALERYLDSLRPRPTATAAAVVAFEEYLTRVGFWPPASAPDQPEDD